MNGLFYEELNPFSIDEEKHETVREYYDVFLSDLCGHDIRNIAIISNRICEQKGRKYLKIVGLDIFTGKIVSLIDNHGKSYGLCSYSENWAQLKSKVVIKVPVELCENVFVCENKGRNLRLFNALRIKGKYEILGKTNWFELNWKYKALHYSSENEAYKLLVEPVSVVKVFELFKNCENLIVYIPVHFSGNHYIKAEGSKIELYNPETEKSFTFISATKKILDNMGKYLNGTAIAKIIIINGKVTVQIDEAVICKYFHYSKNDRDRNAFEAQLQDQQQQQQQHDMKLIAQCERDAAYYNFSNFLDQEADEDEYDFDKYRPYVSMEEYCDEYERFREFEMSNENYLWDDED